jgi:hypothetical protein
MANVVKIELTMDASGAVTGFRSLDAAGTKVQTTIKAVATSGTQMGTAVAGGAGQATAALNATAVAAKTAGSAGSAAMDHVGEHALTSLDSVRLFRDEFGIHIPRSMEKTMAQSQLVMGVLNSMQTAMIGLGAIGIGVALGEEFYKVGRKIFEADDEVKKFNQDMAEAAGKKFMDTQSIEDVRASLANLRTDMAGLDAYRAKLPQSIAGSIGQDFLKSPSGGMALLGDPSSILKLAYDATRDSKARSLTATARNKDQAGLDNDTIKAEENRHKQVMANIEIESKKAAAMQDVRARTLRENSLAHDKDSEDQRHNHQDLVFTATIANRGRDKYSQINVAKNAGDEDRQRADSIADAETAAKQTEFDRQEAQSIAKLNNEANNADLKGYQLLMAEKKQAYADFVREYGGSTSALKAINERYDKEAKKASDELTRSLVANAREAALSSVHGTIPQLEARSRANDSKIDDDLASGKFDAYGSDAEKQAAAEREKSANHAKSNEEMAEADKRFQDDVLSLANTSAEKQVQGFARITAEGKKQLDDLARKAEEVYGKDHFANNPTYLKGVAAINAGTASQTSDLAQKNSEETAKIERDAAARSLPQAQQREAEIRAAYDDRVAAYQKMVDSQELSQDDANRRTVAAAREMNEQLAMEAKAQRDRLASEIEPFMKNPQGAAIALGEKMASQYAASALTHFAGPNAGLGGGKKGSIFDVPMFGKHGSKGMPGVGSAADSAKAAMTSMTVTATTVYVNGHAMGVGGGGAAEGGLVMPGVSGGGNVAGISSGTGRVASSISGSSFTSTGVTGKTSTSSTAAGGGGGLGMLGLPDSTTSSGGGGPYGMLGLPDATAPTAATDAGITGAGPMGIPGTGDVTTVGAAIPGLTKDGGEQALDSAQKYYGMEQSVVGLGSTVNGASSAMHEDGHSAQAADSSSSSKLMGQFGTAASGGMGMFSAVESNGGFSGAMTGASAGAQLGSLFGPAGTLIGAGAGAIIGLVGFGGAEKAKQYEKTQVRPRIEKDSLDFGMGSMDYQSAYADLTSLDMEAKKATKQWGFGGTGEYNNRIKPEITAAQNKLTSEQKAGRSQYGMTAGQFHDGGLIRGFGDYATSSTEGFIHAKAGETVMHQGATDMHGDALGLMLAGANRQQMAGFYGAQQMQPAFRSTMQNGAFGGGGHTFNYGDTNHVNAIDTKSFADAMMANKHSVRGAYNASYAENSGGSDLV